MTITRRGSTYYLRRRVPKRFAGVDSRDYVWMSLGTDSRSEAERKAPEVWQAMIDAWEAKAAGADPEASERFEAARRFARANGFRYYPVDRIARLSTDELLRRIEAVSRMPSGRMDGFERDALLGLAERPRMTVSGALETYWNLTEDEVARKNANQIRIWRNGRKKAIRNFIEVVGDLPLDEISADDMLDFREWWWRRIQEEGLTANAANKDIATLSKILKTVNIRKRLGLQLPLGGLSIRESDKRTRPPFSEDWIRDKILAPGALAGLNTEARCLLLGMVNTGYRPAEACGLMAEHIHLDGDLPYIEIRAVGRDLKTSYSERIIPLCGVSLVAFRECRDGFPRYRAGSGPANLINKYLRSNGLTETPGHTLYSLRHSFEDRLLDRDVDERIRRDLLGHRLNRERYGKGATLEHLHRIVQRVAL